MTYREMTIYLYNEFAKEYADNIKGFKWYYEIFERPSKFIPWVGVRKNKNSDMEIFGIYQHGMKLNLRLRDNSNNTQQNYWIKRFKDAGLNAYSDPKGRYWLLVPITKRDLENSDKLNVILACMNDRYKELQNKF